MEAVKRFIANGKSVNDQDGNGYSALYVFSCFFFIFCSIGMLLAVMVRLRSPNIFLTMVLVFSFPPVLFVEPCLRDEDGDSPLHVCLFSWNSDGLLDVRVSRVCQIAD